ncbi:type II secretion system protein F, partial [Vibrio splendidus]
MLWLSLILFAFVLLLIRDSKVKKVNQFFNIEEVEAEN